MSGWPADSYSQQQSVITRASSISGLDRPASTVLHHTPITPDSFDENGSELQQHDRRCVSAVPPTNNRPLASPYWGYPVDHQQQHAWWQGCFNELDYNQPSSLSDFLTPIPPALEHCWMMPSHNAYSGYGTAKRRIGGRRPKEEEEQDDSFQLDPNELQKRQLRRARNKEAAARCRQRRLDLMNKLQVNVNSLEEEIRQKNKELDKVRQEKEHLEHLLRNHQDCKLNGVLVGMKPKKMLFFNMNRNMKQESTEPTLTQVVTEMHAEVGPIVTTAGMEDGLQRPTTLSFGGGSTPGIPIQTPSSGFNFDLLGSSTGLTPLGNSTSLTPILTGTSIPLETPTTHVSKALYQL